MPDLASISTATKVVFVAALLLLITTFFAWQSVDFGPVSASANAWHGFWGVAMGLLTIVLLIWIGIKVFNAVEINLPEAHVIAGLAAAIFVCALIKNLADDYSTFWSYIGVILAAIVGVGAYLRMKEMGVIAGGFGSSPGSSSEPES